MSYTHLCAETVMSPTNQQDDPMVCLTKSPALTKAMALSTLVTPPIGIAYIAGTLQSAGIHVQVVDAVGENPDQLIPLDFCEGYSIGLSIPEIVDHIDPKCDVIGLSCMFSNSWPYDQRLINAIRKKFSKATIVVGGEHATACPDYILSTCDDVDVCVLGEGEETFKELILALRAGISLEHIPGIVHRVNGQIVRNPTRDRIREIDDISLPDWDLIPIENYMSRGLGHGVSNTRNMPLMATRGCPYQCTFCSSPNMWTTLWKARSFQLVVDEMEIYIKKFNAENFDLYDLTAIIRKDWIVAFANEILSRGLNITYQLPSGTRSEAIDDEVTKLLFASGCRQMNYAPESGSPETLKSVKKKVNLDRLQKSLRAAIKNDLKIMVNIILFPQDSLRDVFKTFAFALKCSWLGLHDITFVPYVPYPGAELYNEMVSDGRLPEPSEKYFISLLTHSDLSSARSYNPNFSARQIQIMRLFFLAGFYISTYIFRPWRLFINIMNMTLNTPKTRGESVLITLARRTIQINKSSG